MRGSACTLSGVCWCWELRACCWGGCAHRERRALCAMEAVQLCLVGASGVGKAQLLQRFGGPSRPVSVPGASPIMATVTARRDDGGAAEALAESALLLVYDITDAASFDVAVSCLKRTAGKAAAVGLVGNKCDRSADRAVAVKRGMDAALAHGASFLETSGKEGANVDDAFCDVLVRAVARGAARPATDETVASRIIASLECLGITTDVAQRCVHQLRPQREADGLRVIELAMAMQWEAAPGSDAALSEEVTVQSLTACGITASVAQATVRQLKPVTRADGLRVMELAMATQWSLT